METNCDPATSGVIPSPLASFWFRNFMSSLERQNLNSLGRGGSQREEEKIITPLKQGFQPLAVLAAAGWKGARRPAALPAAGKGKCSSKAGNFLQTISLRASNTPGSSFMLQQSNFPRARGTGLSGGLMQCGRAEQRSVQCSSQCRKKWKSARFYLLQGLPSSAQKS